MTTIEITKIKYGLVWQIMFTTLLITLLSIPAQAKNKSSACDWLNGEYQIMWPNEAPQPMRITSQGAHKFQVELAVTPDLWIKQPLEYIQNKDGMIPPCVLAVTDYGLFSTTRNLEWYLREDPGEGWAFLARDRPVPVRKLSPTQ